MRYVEHVYQKLWLDKSNWIRYEFYKECLYKLQGLDDEKWIYGEFLKWGLISSGL